MDASGFSLSSAFANSLCINDFIKKPALTTTELASDRARIQAEIAGIRGGIDPFPAAVRATRMPMVITDPTQPDNPIVFVNDSFCRLTGYSRDEFIGRNCRFLQRPETEPASVLKIREDIAAVRSVEVDILDDLGYIAIEAGDSSVGLKVLQSDLRIDLLVTDVGLPGGMNGRQMADAAQGAGSSDQVRVLFA